MLNHKLSNKLVEVFDLQPAIELVGFDIGEVSFGIPITRIVRVINNLFIGEDYTLTQNVQILDLHQLLFGVEISHPDAMAIFNGARHQLYGIPIDTTPTFTSITLDRIRVLPPEFRTGNPLGIASHIAVISTPLSQSAIFILTD